MGVHPHVAVMALGHEVDEPGREASVGHDDHGFLAGGASYQLVRLAVIIATLVLGNAVGERQAATVLDHDVVGNLDAKKAHARRVALGEAVHDVEGGVAGEAHVCQVAAHDVALVRGAGVDGEGKDDLEADLLRPVEGAVHVLDTAHVGAAVRSVLAKDVPRHGQADGVEPARGDAHEVLTPHEILAVLAHEIRVTGAAEGDDQRLLVQGARIGKELGRNPRLEREPTRQVDAVQCPACHGYLRCDADSYLPRSSIAAGWDNNATPLRTI